MNFIFSRYTSALCTLLCLVVLQGCSSDEFEDTSQGIPVTWSTGYTMPSLLASPDVVLVDINDLAKLIDAAWYSSVLVTNTNIGETAFSSCADYFKLALTGSRPVKDNEMNAYLEFKTMCEATRMLVNASTSMKTFLPEIILDGSIPDLWPEKFALNVVEDHTKPDISSYKTWSDVTAIIKTEILETKSLYFHDGGYQELEIIGKADVDHDGTEDVIIVVRDYLEGGNYFNMRLFVMSVDEKGSWRCIEGI